MAGMAAPQFERLTPDRVRAGLQARFLGHRVVYRETLDSTNSVAKALAQEGSKEGTLILAEEQTAGRGRLGRTWLAPRGSSLLFSLVLRPSLHVSRAHGLTMACSLAVCEAIRAVTDLSVQLKWPNDVVFRGRKMGGILTEVSTVGERLEYAVIGIGLNVNVPSGALPAEFQSTSLQQELCQTVSRLELLQQILVQIEQRYLDLLNGEWPAQAWAGALETLGQRVCLHTQNGGCSGTATGVDEDGALLLGLDDGQIQRVLVGDIVAQETELGSGQA